MSSTKPRRKNRSKSIIDTSHRLILHSEIRNLDEIFYCEHDLEETIDITSYLEELKDILNEELEDIVDQEILDKMFQNFEEFSRHDVWTLNKDVDKRKMIVYLFDFTEKDQRKKFFKYILKHYRDLVETDIDQPLPSPTSSPKSVPASSYLKKRNSWFSSLFKKKYRLPETLLPEFKWELDKDSVIIEKKLSDGSYGTVYLGTFQNKKVAIKKLPSVICDERSRTILNEISLLCRLDHANIVKFIGATLGEEISLITQYERRGDLHNLLKRKKNKNRLSARRTIEMAKDITKGIEYLHSNNIVHGDLKPSNILVSSSYRCKLSDFGLSFKSRPSTRNTQALGTLPYLAPELVRDVGRIPSIASDIYSLGMIFYELIEYSPPYQGYDLIKLSHAKDVNEIPKITQPCSHEFKTLIYRCLSEADERPSIDEVLNILNLM